MKIVNVSLQAPYNENWGYHENLLPKWQERNGNDVTLITTRFVNNKNDDGSSATDAIEYVNENGVKVIRLDWLSDNWICRNFRLYKNTYETIEKEKPDFLFIHGCQFLDAIAVCRYLKDHPEVKAVCDNHSDETNSAMSFLAKMLHRILWCYTANRLNKYVLRFYGVLPIRCDFLSKYYHIPSDKIELLVMGADDDVINEAQNRKEETINIYKIDHKKLNIVCGGKFDHFKTEVLELMKAVKNMDKVHLYVYGSIGDEIKEEFNDLLVDNITYTGWLDQTESYSLLLSCDVAFFPGRHSVIWEQCVGLGIPLVVKDYPGTHHVDTGNNCIFIKDPDETKMRVTIASFLNDDSVLENMKKAASSDKKYQFRYSEIARKSLSL